MIILFLVQLFFVASAKLCDDWKSVDLSDAKLIHDGTFVKNGTRFPPDYVYSKNVSGVPKHFGCLCDLKKCFRKCCPLGEVFLKRNGTKSCIKGYDVLQVKGLNVSFMTEYKRTINLTDGELQLIHGVPCNGDVFLEFNMWFVQEVTSTMVGSAATSAEQAKRRKYENLDSSFIFVPFGVETLGPWGRRQEPFSKNYQKGSSSLPVILERAV
ncbi:jg11251 [Pararge aegeria aegeria]|uniref:Jg11251 protein n=1 Tax=Pararge aegeria aegeria TaxID=348720 RepID=A0A8S4RIV8_9NEOP|nr:jg11251 [Pararge aegeria aegeria]